jgi:hypothetical protein
MRLTPPAYLDARQAARFRELAKAVPPNLLRPSDAVALAGLVAAESLLSEVLARRAADPDGGLLGRGDRGATIIGTLTRIEFRALAAIGAYLQALGMTPASRAGLPYEMTRRLEDMPTLTEIQNGFVFGRRRRTRRHELGHADPAAEA